MGICLECIVTDSEHKKDPVLKASKFSNRDDILKRSNLDYESSAQELKTNSPLHNSQTLKDSFFPFPQDINSKAKDCIMMYCPFNKKSIPIEMNEAGIIKCSCSNSNIVETQMKVFMEKFALNNFSNHKCNLHKAEGEFCPMCTCWVCDLCKSEYHNKHYIDHHLLFFKMK